MKASTPVIGTENIAASREFYTRHFDFEISFEADWYICFVCRHNPDYELALIDCLHASIPEAFRHLARGVLINFEVADVDAVYNTLKVEDLPMLLELRP
jgi:catechol 2,3-dioxygenase-like lactoylglutathione lyase family enzyme